MNKYIAMLWRIPSLDVPSNDTHKQASWLELFFDLVMIVAFSKIEKLMHPISTQGTVLALLAFFSVALPWVNILFYSQRLEDLTVRHRLIMFTMMMLLLGNAIAFSSADTTHFTTYARVGIIAFVIIRLFLSYIWYSASKQDKSHITYSFSKVYMVVYAISSLLVLSNLLLVYVSSWLPMATWGLALVVEITLPKILSTLMSSKTADKASAKLDIHAGHTLERVGLFVMLMLGELVLSSLTLTNKNIAPSNVLISAGLILFGVFAIWWIYYDRVIDTMVNIKESWIYVQLLFIFTLLLCGVATATFLESEDWGYNQLSHEEYAYTQEEQDHAAEATGDHSKMSESFIKAFLPTALGLALALIAVLTLFRKAAENENKGWVQWARTVRKKIFLHTMSTVLVFWILAIAVYGDPHLLSVYGIVAIILVGLIYQMGIGFYYWVQSLIRLKEAE